MLADHLSTPADWAEDSGHGLVYVGSVLTLPVTVANDGYRAVLMQLDLGVGPSPDEILSATSMFQLTNDLTYAVSLSEIFKLTQAPTDLDGIELSEGSGSNITKAAEHHGARTMARQWRCPNDEVDRTAYRYLSVVVSASSTAATSGVYLTVNRDYGQLDCMRWTPFDWDAYTDDRIAAYLLAHPPTP
jgi:hypothetical protein